MIIPKRCIYLSVPEFDLGLIEQTLPSLKFRDCSKEMEESWGFYQYDELESSNEIYAYKVDRFTLVNLRHDIKKLNKTKLSRAWRKQLIIEEEEAGIVFDKARRKEVRLTTAKKLLKDVEPTEAYHKAVFDSLKSRVYLLVSAPAQAEFLVDKINRALGEQNTKIGFNVEDYKRNELGETLTNWLNNPSLAIEEGFEIGESMMLKGDDDSTATLKNQNAEASEVREHLHNRKMVNKLAMSIDIADSGIATFVTTGDKILSQIDLKNATNEQIKAEKETQESIDSLKAAEFLIRFSVLSDLCDKVENIPVE